MPELKSLLFVLMTIVSIVEASDFYYYDKQQQYTIDTIDNAQFTAFEEVINRGLKNGVYWLKIDQDFDNDSFIQIKNSHIKNVIAYQQGKVIDSLPENNLFHMTWEK